MKINIGINHYNVLPLLLLLRTIPKLLEIVMLLIKVVRLILFNYCLEPRILWSHIRSRRHLKSCSDVRLPKKYKTAIKQVYLVGA